MTVSLFMDPDLAQIELAASIGADRIELYTGPYAAAWGTDDLEPIFQQHLAAAALATSLGMGVNAGHDLNLDNLAKFASIPSLLEVSIGPRLYRRFIGHGYRQIQCVHIKHYSARLSHA